MNDDTGTTHTGDVVTLWVNGQDSREGAATLTLVTDTIDGHIAHVVSVDERATEYYGIAQPVSVVGSLVRSGGRWSPTAFHDRAHLFDDEEPVYYLPDARSRVHGVRVLLRWWWVVARRTREGADPRLLDPFQLSASDRRFLLG
ncbi:hypothetical protein [Amycolatopsis sp. NPDC004079]|uniref:hypothetical protein n=1 Tax=Amycolatopsis sp. NPDC004079 TaxID=3154549 RepID=UPI0033B3D45F